MTGAVEGRYHAEVPDVEVAVMAARIQSRAVWALIAMLALAVVLVPAGTAGSKDEPAAMPTLYVQYAMNCTFTIVDDFGRRVSSIPPGTYQVEVSTPVMFKLVVPGGPGVDHIAANDFTGCKGWVQFQLQGPGVDLFTTLDSGCDAFLLLPAQNFRAGSTYTFQDLNQPAVTRTALSVATSGSAETPSSPYSGWSGKSETIKDIVGSAIKRIAFRGTLDASLSPTGKPTLKKQGKSVSTLRSGRYKFQITDRDAKGGFTIQGVGKKASKTLTTADFVGKKSVSVTLSPGRWTFYSGLGKVNYYFLVTH
jgi:hypothetical protein